MCFLPARGSEQGNAIGSVLIGERSEPLSMVFNDQPRDIIRERSEPFSRVFNDQPRDVYRWCPTVRTKCKLLFLQTQTLLADNSTNVCHTCPLTFNDSYNPFQVERKFEIATRAFCVCMSL